MEMAAGASALAKPERVRPARTWSFDRRQRAEVAVALHSWAQAGIAQPSTTNVSPSACPRNEADRYVCSRARNRVEAGQAEALYGESRGERDCGRTPDRAEIHLTAFTRSATLDSMPPRTSGSPRASRSTHPSLGLPAVRLGNSYSLPSLVMTRRVARVVRLS